MNKNIVLNQTEVEIILSILQAYLPSSTIVWLFGSRATGHAKKYSDIDLLVQAEDPLSLAIMAELNHAFEESSLPYKVDLVDWNSISEAFKKNIENQKIKIFQSK